MNGLGVQASGLESLGSMTPAHRTLVVGCGYVGEAVARRLRSLGHDVFGLRRSDPWSLAPGLPYVPLQGDLTDPGSLDAIEALDTPFDWVIHTVSASGGDAEAYRRVYFEGTGHLLDRLRHHPPHAFVYTSSTSVYSQTDGSWVDELSPADPGSESVGWLLRTEQLILDAWRAWGLAGRILRVAGIYGPERGSLLRRALSGQAHLEGAGDRWTNRIHREDLADAIVAALSQGRPGEIYNAADLEPATQKTVLEWLSEQTGVPLAEPSGGPQPVTRRRGGSNKRVCVDKLRRETGWTPTHRSFREGYLEELGRLGGGEATRGTGIQSRPVSRA